MTSAMMIDTLQRLGDWMNPKANNHESLFYRAQSENPWFTPDSCTQAFNAWSTSLKNETLTHWLEQYELPHKQAKKIGLVLAGNIPLVGLHDVLCVLLSGHSAQVKGSSSDTILMKAVIEQLSQIDPSLQSQISWVQRLQDFDAVIATGSSNTSRYFEYYFSKYPHIIRKNRTSVAVLTGDESREQLEALGKDIFSYFGMGCRNVSKLFVPNEYDFHPFFEAIQPYHAIAQHHKYHNNYDYNRALLLLNKSQHLDNGFLLVEENTELHAPLSTLYVEKYRFLSESEAKIESIKDAIQCKVGLLQGYVPFGKAQEPEFWDYADNIDTLAFLLSI